jgi:CHAT domain-containing protein
LSAVHREQGALLDAKERLQAALAIREQLLGPSAPVVGATLRELAVLDSRRGDYAAATEKCARAVTILVDALGAGNAATLETRWMLAVLSREKSAADPEAPAHMHYRDGCAAADAGYFDEAETRLSEATQLNRESLGDDHPVVASCLLRLGQLYETQSRPTEAYAALREALYIHRLHAELDHSGSAPILATLAGVELQRGLTSEAERYADDAVAALDSASSPADFAGVWHIVGRTQHAAGQLAEAESTFRNALDRLATIGGPDEGRDDPEFVKAEAALLGNLAVVEAETGKYTDAKASYRRALSLKEQATGKEHPSYAATAVNYATLLADLGETRAACSTLKAAASTLERLYGAGHPKTQHAKVTLAMVSDQLGAGPPTDWKDLLSAYETSETRDVRGTSIVRNRLAEELMAQGDLAGAESLLATSVTDMTVAYGEDHPLTTRTQHSLARLRLAQGGTAEARELFERIRVVLSQVGSSDYPVLHDTLHRLAILESAANPERASGLLDEAIRAEDANLPAIFGAVGEDRRMDQADALETSIALYLSLVDGSLGSSDRARWTAANLVLRRKGLVRDVLLRERSAVAGTGHSALDREYREFTHVRAAVSRLTLEGPRVGGLEHSERELAALRHRRDELEESLLPKLATSQALRDILDCDARSISASLPANAVLLEFVQTPALKLDGLIDTAAAYFVMVLRPGRVPAVIKLGSLTTLDEAVDGYLEVISSEPEARADSADLRRLGEVLRRTILDPAIAPCDLPEQLLISPAGRIWNVPFEALPIDGTRWLVEAAELRYLPTGRWLGDARPAEASEAGPPSVVADPDHDRSDPASERSQLERQMADEIALWERGDGAYPLGYVTMLDDNDEYEPPFEQLAGSREEGLSVASLLEVEPVLGPDATKNYLKGLRSPAVLHLATHGFFITDENELQSLYAQRLLGAQSWSFTESNAVMELSMKRIVDLVRGLAGGGDPTDADPAGDPTELQSIWTDDADPFSEELSDPFLRSGLALAGINTWLLRRPIDEACGNGLLSTAEVAELDLSGTELVVLSACETGSGSTERLDGVLGLSRAFAVAGARSLVLTLWSLPDEDPTPGMITDFYSRLIRGARRGQALRDAKLTLCHRQVDPYFWGSLVLQGDDGVWQR